MQRKYRFAEGEFYHVYNRGNNKRVLFKTHSDYSRFMFLLFIANSSEPVRVENLMRQCREQGRSLLTLIGEIDRGESLVDIGAYCLMPNHFHLLLHEKKEDGITKFMSKVSTGYSMYFNKKYEREGTLFEGRFKALHADSDRYLKYLFAYIHLNPVSIIDPGWKEGKLQNIGKAKRYVRNYFYSSYPDYSTDGRTETLILTKKAFPGYFSKRMEFKNFIDQWLSLKGE